MAEKTKTVKLPVTVVVHDEENSVEQLLDQHGRVVQHKQTATKKIEAGQPVDLPAAKADALLERFGGEEVGVRTHVPLDPASTEVTRTASPKAASKG